MLDLRNKIVQTILVYFSLVCLLVFSFEMCGLGPNNCVFFVCSLPSPSWVSFDLSSHSSLCFADVKLEGDVNCQLVDQTRFNLSSPDQSVTVGRFFSGKKNTTVLYYFGQYM